MRIDFRNKNYRVITLCGSLKFIKEFCQAQIKLERMGHVCLSVCAGEDLQPPTQNEKSIIDKVHFKKINLSDCILVLDLPHGDRERYWGESTENEIQFAQLNNKPVFWISEHTYLL